MAMSVEVGIKDARAATSAALQALGWSVSDANVQADTKNLFLNDGTENTRLYQTKDELPEMARGRSAKMKK